MGTGTDRDKLLARLASRVVQDSSFFASVLHAYKVEEKLGDGELAEELGVSLAALARLGLCRRPASGSPEFVGQLRQIGEYVGVDPSKLAAMVRRVEAVEALRGIPARKVGEEEARTPSLGHARGVMAFAQDRTEPDQDEAPPEDEEKPAQDGPNVDRQRDA